MHTHTHTHTERERERERDSFIVHETDLIPKCKDFLRITINIIKTVWKIEDCLKVTHLEKWML